MIKENTYRNKKYCLTKKIYVAEKERNSGKECYVSSE
jgi:hypothetical protein